MKGYNIGKRGTFQPQTDSHYRPLCSSKLKIILLLETVFLKKIIHVLINWLEIRDILKKVKCKRLYFFAAYNLFYLPLGLFEHFGALAVDLLFDSTFDPK